MRTFIIYAAVFFLSFTALAARLIHGWRLQCKFDKNCGIYLVRAYHASNLETQKLNLYKALDYFHSFFPTEGDTSTWHHDPANDVLFWWNNASSAYETLLKEWPASHTEQQLILCANIFPALPAFV